MKYKVITKQTLLEALQLLAPESSKTTHRSWIKEGRVAVNGIIAKQGSLTVEPGEEVLLGPKRKILDHGVEILYEDDHFVAIEKPYGLLSVATAFEKGETAHGILKAHYRPRKVSVVHRLDQETSGVMIFALSEEAYERFKVLFEKHDLKRIYVAVVEGLITPKKGTWKSFLHEDANYYVRSVQDENLGRESITHFSVKGYTKKNTLLELELETGRKNQIRVHCQDAKHPVVGDKKYGAVTNPLKRLCLHAKSLTFNHPITGKKMHFESEVPQDFFKLVPTHA
jgi:tRNA pseudouridine32 synthase/23S rRNA pseudouridine746 synthase/23S rRNA pseudouridine1911/1915/1917 synthase